MLASLDIQGIFARNAAQRLHNVVNTQGNDVAMMMGGARLAAQLLQNDEVLVLACLGAIALGGLFASMR